MEEIPEKTLLVFLLYWELLIRSHFPAVWRRLWWKQFSTTCVSQLVVDESDQQNSPFTYSSLYFTSMFLSLAFRMGYQEAYRQLILLGPSSPPLCCAGLRFSVSDARFSDMKTFLFSSLCERKKAKSFKRSVGLRLWQHVSWVSLCVCVLGGMPLRNRSMVKKKEF